jgi:hypothetical protein
MNLNCKEKRGKRSVELERERRIGREYE